MKLILIELILVFNINKIDININKSYMNINNDIF